MKKGFIIGLATGLTIATTSFVLASSHVQALLNDQIKVTLNGVEQKFVDEKTNETQYPLTYKDRTYLPLRTVANLVGVNVDYDTNTNTAILNTNDGALKSSKVEGEDGWDGEVTLFKDKYLVMLLKNPYSEAESTLIVSDYFTSSRTEHYFDVAYNVEQGKFMCSVEDNRLLVSAYEFYSNADDNEMTKLCRVDYEILEKDGELVKNILVKDETDIKHTASVQ